MPVRRKADDDGAAVMSAGEPRNGVAGSLFRPGPRNPFLSDMIAVNAFVHRPARRWMNAGVHVPEVVGERLNDDGVAHAEVPTSTVRPRSRSISYNSLAKSEASDRLEDCPSLASKTSASSK